jgi:hypothetical protein
MSKKKLNLIKITLTSLLLVSLVLLGGCGDNSAGSAGGSTTSGSTNSNTSAANSSYTNEFEINTDNYVKAYRNMEGMTADDGCTFEINSNDLITLNYPSYMTDNDKFDYYLNDLSKNFASISLDNEHIKVTYFAYEKSEYRKDIDVIVSGNEANDIAEYHRFTVNGIVGYYAKDRDVSSVYEIYLDSGTDDFYFKINADMNTINYSKEDVLSIEDFISKYSVILQSSSDNYTDNSSELEFQINTDNYLKAYLNQANATVDGLNTIYTCDLVSNGDDKVTFTFPSYMTDSDPTNLHESLNSDSKLYFEIKDEGININYYARIGNYGIDRRIDYIQKNQGQQYHKFTVNGIVGYYTTESDDDYSVFVDTGMDELQFLIEINYDLFYSGDEIPIEELMSKYFVILQNPPASSSATTGVTI